MEEYRHTWITENDRTITKKGTLRLIKRYDGKELCFFEEDTLPEMMANKGRAVLHTVAEKPGAALGAAVVTVGKVIVKGVIENATGTKLGRDRTENGYVSELSKTFREYDNRFSQHHSCWSVMLRDVEKIECTGPEEGAVKIWMRNGKCYGVFLRYAFARNKKFYKDLKAEYGWK